MEVDTYLKPKLQIERIGGDAGDAGEEGNMLGVLGFESTYLTLMDMSSVLSQSWTQPKPPSCDKKM